MRVSWTPYKHINFQRVEELLQESLQTKQLTNYGPNVKRLEQFMRQKLQIDDNRAVIATCNATVSLDVIARGIDLKTSNDNQWVTQSFTFPSSAQVKGGNSTKIVDIDSSYGLDLTDPEVLKADGMFVTNIFGTCVDIKKYEEYAMKNKKFLVFDNAACLHTLYDGKSIHNYGHASILSLHHTKSGGFAEGGFVFTTRDMEPVVRRLLNFGIDNASFNPKWEPMGMNGKMSDVSSSFILSYLEENFEYIVSHHKSLYDAFSEKMKSLDQGHVRMFSNFSDESPVVPCLCVVFQKNTDRLVDMLKNSGIYSRSYYNPLDPSCKRSMKLYETIICLPCHTDVTFDNLDEYIGVIENFLNEN